MGRKVILSRKGFDGTSGGSASPIIDGKFVSLPIPRAESGITYRSLQFNENHDYMEVMRNLNIRQFTETHLDPDIRKSVLTDRPKEWRGLFGQSRAAQKILMNKKVSKGDIFLFFGWFQEAEMTKKGYCYKTNAPDIHAIYGYLEVDEMFDIKKGEAVPNWVNYHPHIVDRKEYGKQQNAIYMATKQSSVDPSKQGWGCFEYHDDLVLTQKGQKRSKWEVPSFFNSDEFNGKVTCENLENGNKKINFIGKNNQELYISEDPRFVEWAENLIRTRNIYE